VCSKLWCCYKLCELFIFHLFLVRFDWSKTEIPLVCFWKTIWPIGLYWYSLKLSAEIFFLCPTTCTICAKLENLDWNPTTCCMFFPLQRYGV
jgi:hypothetical protein